MPSSSQTLITETIGLIAGILTASSGIPQVISIYHNNNDSISPSFLYILFIGGILWLIYAILLNTWRGKDDSIYTAISLIIFQSLTTLTIILILLKMSCLK